MCNLSKIWPLLNFQLLNTLNSKASSEGLKLPTQIYYIEKDLWQSLSKLPVKVSAGLNEDLTSIMVSEDQCNNTFFMKFFWEEQQKYIKCFSRGIQYHDLIIKLCLWLEMKSTL